MFSNGLSRRLMSDSEIKSRVESLMKMDRSAISRTITLIESSKEEHRDYADKIMKELFA